jgi:hypothetical protein
MGFFSDLFKGNRTSYYETTKEGYRNYYWPKFPQNYPSESILKIIKDMIDAGIKRATVESYSFKERKAIDAIDVIMRDFDGTGLAWSNDILDALEMDILIGRTPFQYEDISEEHKYKLSSEGFSRYVFLRMEANNKTYSIDILISKDFGGRLYLFIEEKTDFVEHDEMTSQSSPRDAVSSPKIDTAHFLVVDPKTGKAHSEFRYRGSNDFDTFPQGHGNFGTSVTNPIPTCGITGSSEYLARLRTKNGEEISVKRLGCTGSDNIEELIDHYEIYNKQTKEKLCELYLCPYSKQTSTLAPDGFTLV